jgi:hypothetical protein
MDAVDAFLFGLVAHRFLQTAMIRKPPARTLESPQMRSE